MDNINKYIKKDKAGKYALVDSNKKVIVDNLSRLEAYSMLIECGYLKPHKMFEELENYVLYVNRLLDGSLQAGRFKFYRTSLKTETLEQQMIFDQRISFVKGDVL